MNRIAVLLIGTIVLLVLGLIYAWSIFVAPLEGEFGWSRSETSLTFSISMMMWSIGMLAVIMVVVFLLSLPFLRRQMLVSTPFWTFTLWRVLAMGAGAAVIAQAAPLMAELGTDAVVQAFAVGALAIGNGCGRPIIGAIYDKLGRDRTLIALPCLGFLAGALLVISYLNGMSALFAVALFCEGVVYGGYASINVSFIETTFGRQYLSMNIGINSFVLMPFNVIFPMLSAFVFQVSGGYAPYLAMLPIIAVISLFAGFITKPAIQHMRGPRS